MSFRITGLPAAEFADLFPLDDEALRARVREVVEELDGLIREAAV